MSDIDFGASLVNQPVTRARQVVHRMPRNPLDKCTFVSLYPVDILYESPTMFPGRFIIKRPELDKEYGLSIIEPSSFWLQSRGENMPPIEAQVNAMEISDGIIRDAIKSMKLIKENVGPGVFYLLGEYDEVSVKSAKGFDTALMNARMKQQNYWLALVEEADYFWAGSNGNPRAVPQTARLAAKILGLEKQKPWMTNVVASELAPCPFCGTMINHLYPICISCKGIVNPEKAKALNIQFAR